MSLVQLRLLRLSGRQLMVLVDLFEGLGQSGEGKEIPPRHGERDDIG